MAMATLLKSWMSEGTIARPGVSLTSCHNQRQQQSRRRPTPRIGRPSYEALTHHVQILFQVPQLDDSKPLSLASIVTTA